MLFAYARPAHLARVLAALRENQVPLIYAYADGARGPADAAAVAAVRAQLRAVDWCELRLHERAANLGLGRNVLAGVGEVAARHPAFIVWEDDLVCVPGTYAWLCAALRHYAADDRVMSVTAWSHPRITPADLGARPYLDARAECWVWGGYARAWRGMEQSACEKLAAVRARGLAPDAYGADLPVMARAERRRNIWAVRWLYHHLQHGGLCVRPPWSMVEHIGFDAAATNAGAAAGWANPPLAAAPPVPAIWPEAVEHPDCRARWQAAAGRTPGLAARLLRRLVPARLLDPVRRRFFRVRWEGNFPDWAAARAAATGYDAAAITERVIAAARRVRAGAAAYERDGVAFTTPPPPWPPLVFLAGAPRAGQVLHVLDFGGALGGLYHQNRAALRAAAPLRWAVVEQPGLAAAGRREFAGGELEFYSSVAEACDAGVPDVVLLASVLCYLPSPFAVLADLLRTMPARVIVERTGFTAAGPTRLMVQRVPRSIYPASYPCWFFARDEFLAAFAGRYRVAREWRDEVATPAGVEFRSLCLERVHP
ncbi:MAG: methyltransferase, TIGR04325 family [Opitutaceae bacterium]|nr:methyltransferase, TIGR04325 family [Opitutaceae bacterium]